MHDPFSEFFEWLIRLTGTAIDDASEHVLALAIFAACTIFAFVAGFFFTGIAAAVFFAVTGFCGAVLALIACGWLG